MCLLCLVCVVQWVEVVTNCKKTFQAVFWDTTLSLDNQNHAYLLRVIFCSECSHPNRAFVFCWVNFYAYLPKGHGLDKP